MQVERCGIRREIDERRASPDPRDAQRRSNYRRAHGRRTVTMDLSTERRAPRNRRADLRRAGVDRRLTEARRKGARRMNSERRTVIIT